MKIYAVGYRAVDPEEDGYRGIGWSVDEDDVLGFYESEIENPPEVDTEYLFHEIELSEEGSALVSGLPDTPLSNDDNERILDELSGVVWSERLYYDRRVLLGSEYPGGESRRNESLDYAARIMHTLIGGAHGQG